MQIGDCRFRIVVAFALLGCMDRKSGLAGFYGIKCAQHLNMKINDHEKKIFTGGHLFIYELPCFCSKPEA
jgi:hypothetical protein